MKRRIVLRRSPIHGNGVFAARNLSTEQHIAEYRGRRLTHKEVNNAYGGDADSGHTFLFTLNDRYVIDANVGGNASRWINHACTTNCIADEIDGRVFIKARRAIKAGDELFYDYGLVIDERYTPALKKRFECRCGTRGCRGTMLSPKR